MVYLMDTYLQPISEYCLENKVGLQFRQTYANSGSQSANLNSQILMHYNNMIYHVRSSGALVVIRKVILLLYIMIYYDILYTLY